MRDPLDADAVQAALSGLDGWSGDTAAIRRTVTVDGQHRQQLVSELESIAREMDHDPDLDFAADALTITMSTHSAGGVTELDVEYARRVNELLGRLS